MTFLEAIISGAVQGVTEFLPISSSGHLVILHAILGFKEPALGFDVFLHGGTLLAVLIVLRRDILSLFSSNRKTGGLIILATFVTAGFVLLFGHRIEKVFSDTRTVSLMLVVTGIWLIGGSFLRFGSGSTTWIKSAFIGLAQGIAAIPGISRSGATISTALFLGMHPEEAVRFSFLLFIPAVIGAFLFEARNGAFSNFNPNYIAGFITSCIIGIISLKLLLKIAVGNRLHLFGIYCILVGIFALIVL